MCYIYLITNKIDNKQYVGHTIGKDIYNRWRDYYNVRKNQIGLYFYNALEKYRSENFKFEIMKMKRTKAECKDISNGSMWNIDIANIKTC